MDNSPLKKVIAILDNKQRKFRRQVLEMQDLLPVFEKTLSAKIKRPKIQYFEDLPGIKDIYWDSLEKPNSEILNYSSADDCAKCIYSLINQYIKERVKKEIRVKVITPAPSKSTSAWLEKSIKKELRQYKILPKGFELSSEYLIYRDKIATISLDVDHNKLWGTIIQDRELARNQKKIFNLLWKLL